VVSRTAILRKWLKSALDAAEVTGNEHSKANVLQSLGDLELRLDNVDAARQHFEDALPLYEAVCSRLGKANVQISDFELGLDSVDTARQHVQDALQQIQSPGDSELGDLVLSG
jgi:hypothetical protein